MKKYIFMALVLLYGTVATAQNTVQRTKKVMVFHMSDGTKIRQNLYFDKDTEISTTNDSIRINVEKEDSDMQDCKTRTTPDVAVDNGNLAQFVNSSYPIEEYCVLPNYTEIDTSYFRAYATAPTLGLTYCNKMQE